MTKNKRKANRKIKKDKARKIKLTKAEQDLIPRALFNAAAWGPPDPNVVLPKQHLHNLARAELLYKYTYEAASFENHANEIVNEIAEAMEKFKLLWRAFKINHAAAQEKKGNMI
jgi:hypothetical protein